MNRPLYNLFRLIGQLIAIIPVQLSCYHLTCARGLDTELPRTIRKVTETH